MYGWVMGYALWLWDMNYGVWFAVGCRGWTDRFFFPDKDFPRLFETLDIREGHLGRYICQL